MMCLVTIMVRVGQLDIESFRNGRTDSAAEDPPADSLFGKPAADRERAKTKSPTSYLGRIILGGTACLFLPANKFWASFRVGLFVWCGSEQPNKQEAQDALRLHEFCVSIELTVMS